MASTNFPLSFTLFHAALFRPRVNTAVNGRQTLMLSPINEVKIPPRRKLQLLMKISAYAPNATAPIHTLSSPSRSLAAPYSIVPSIAILTVSPRGESRTPCARIRAPQDCWELDRV